MLVVPLKCTAFRIFMFATLPFEMTRRTEKRDALECTYGWMDGWIDAHIIYLCTQCTWE